MANFQDFVQIELPLRPVVQSNPPEETVLVRRGTGPRIYAPVDINEGEVLGKLGGVIQSVSNGAVTYQTITVPANTTITIATYTYIMTTSKKVVLDLTNGVDYEAFECLILRTSASTTEYSIYGGVGNLPDYVFDVVDGVSGYDVKITNNSIYDIDVNYREVA